MINKTQQNKTKQNQNQNQNNRTSFFISYCVHLVMNNKYSDICLRLYRESKLLTNCSISSINKWCYIKLIYDETVVKN